MTLIESTREVAGGALAEGLVILLELAEPFSQREKSSPELDRCRRLVVER